MAGSTNNEQSMQNFGIHKLLTKDWEETGMPCQRNEAHEEEHSHRETVSERYLLFQILR